MFTLHPAGKAFSISLEIEVNDPSLCMPIISVNFQQNYIIYVIVIPWPKRDYGI